MLKVRVGWLRGVRPARETEPGANAFKGSTMWGIKAEERTLPIVGCVGLPIKAAHCESRKDWTGQRAPAQARDNLKSTLELTERARVSSRYRKVSR